MKSQIDIVQHCHHRCVMMGRTPYIGRFGSPGKEDREVVQEAMRLTNCLGFADRSILCLSGGEIALPRRSHRLLKPHIINRPEHFRISYIHG